MFLSLVNGRDDEEIVEIAVMWVFSGLSIRGAEWQPLALGL